MCCLNSVSLTGILAADPVLLRLRDGNQALEMCVEVEDGTQGGATSLIDCVLHGPQAADLARVLTKGGKVALGGSLRQLHEGQGGEASRRTVVCLREVHLTQGALLGDAHLQDLEIDYSDVY